MSKFFTNKTLQVFIISENCEQTHDVQIKKKFDEITTYSLKSNFNYFLLRLYLQNVLNVLFIFQIYINNI